MKSDIETLRYAVRLFDGCNETFNQAYTAEELLTLALAYRACGWEFTPDQWEGWQVAECLYEGLIPQWDEDESAIEGKKGA